MPDFNFPGDARSLPEYRLFEEDLLSQGCGRAEPLFVFTSLKLTLAYQASATGVPGLLTDSGRQLLRIDLERAQIAADAALRALDKHLLTETNEGWLDPAFAKANPHLSPDHKRSVDVGAMHSRIKRNRRNIQADADRQQILLPPGTYADSSGVQLGATEINQLLVLMGTIDKCLERQSARRSSEITPGLVADAVDALRRMPPWTEEQRYAFFYWIADHRGDPRMFNTTELILKNFERVLEMYKASGQA